MSRTFTGIGAGLVGGVVVGAIVLVIAELADVDLPSLVTNIAAGVGGVLPYTAVRAAPGRGK